MIFSFDLLPAHKGDCFLIHFGTHDQPGLILVDGGPKSVYGPSLRPRLQQIRESRSLAEEDSLPVDLLMVSHVDDDHIQGLLDLTREELEATSEQRSTMLNVLSFWHNSFDAVIDAPRTDLSNSMGRQFGAASLAGATELSDSARSEVEEAAAENPEVVNSSLLVLASLEQGFRLRINAEGLGYPPNPEFGGKLIVAQPEPVYITPDLTLTVVGPMQPELEALRKKHQKWLADLARQGKSPPEALASYVDKSVPNLSSIVVLVQYGGKCMLLTGDARGDKVLEGLRLSGLLGPEPDARIEVDLLKVPHHGSSNNLDFGFFEKIVAKHYVFSGNGEHGNPERETMEMLFNARGAEPFTIHMTYPIAKIDEKREREWYKEQAKEKTRAIRNSSGNVRPDWSAEKNGLADFFEKRELGRGQFLSIFREKEPHLIELLESLESG